MTTFSAVVTTGIYCRPGCPAKPHERNVRTYTVAAAAEAAGFRACHRCRPYRAEPAAVVSGPDLVCRAVQLIVNGALDDATEDDLARGLGVSSRHLRRLFAEHVGVTPDELARSRRTHFARRLLDDTDLTVTQIAYASGFGSVRQLNRACLDVFRATPTELRARRRRSDRLAADGGLALRLPFDGPLDFHDMLAYFARRAIPGVEHVDLDSGVYRRTVLVDGDPGVLELGAGEHANELILTAHLPHWEGLIHVVQRARRIFNLDADMDGAAKALVADPLVGPLLDARPGLRPPGTWDAFETGVRAIVGQQVSVAAATTVTGRIAARVGTPVPGLTAMGLTHVFPSPAQVADADLTGIGLTGARQHTVRAFAAAVADGAVSLAGPRPLDDFVRSLTAVRGVGPWTAQYLALRMGEPDAFPATDLALARALESHGLTAADTERWRPFRAHAAVRLWLLASPA